MSCRCAATTSGRRASSRARCSHRRSPRSSWARPNSVSHLPPTRRRPAGDHGTCLTGSEVPSAPHRGGAPLSASLRHGRECPLCVRTHEAGQRALALLMALIEYPDGRRAFESGYGLCVRHAAQATAMPDAAALGDIVAHTMHARLALLRWELEEQLRRGAWQARPQRRGVEFGGLVQGRRAFRRHHLARVWPSGSMAASLGGDTPAITARSLRHSIPPQMAKLELRAYPGRA